MAWIVPVIGLVGAAVGAVGQYQEGQQAKAVGDAQAKILKQQARQAQELAAVESDEYLRQQHRLLGTHRALAGATGGTYTGSMLDVATDMAAEMTFQAAKIRSGGDIQSARLRQEAALQRMAGGQAQQASYLRSGATLIQGAGQSYGMLQGR